MLCLSLLVPTLSLPQIKRRVHITAISLSLTHKEFVDKSVDCEQLAQLTKMDRISVDRVRLWLQMFPPRKWDDMLTTVLWNMICYRSFSGTCGLILSLMEEDRMLLTVGYCPTIETSYYIKP